MRGHGSPRRRALCRARPQSGLPDRGSAPRAPAGATFPHGSRATRDPLRSRPRDRSRDARDRASLRALGGSGAPRGDLPAPRERRIHDADEPGDVGPAGAADGRRERSPARPVGQRLPLVRRARRARGQVPGLRQRGLGRAGARARGSAGAPARAAGPEKVGPPRRRVVLPPASGARSVGPRALRASRTLAPADGRPCIAERQARSVADPLPLLPRVDRARSGRLGGLRFVPGPASHGLLGRARALRELPEPDSPRSGRARSPVATSRAIVGARPLDRSQGSLVRGRTLGALGATPADRGLAVALSGRGRADPMRARSRGAGTSLVFDADTAAADTTGSGEPERLAPRLGAPPVSGVSVADRFPDPHDTIAGARRGCGGPARAVASTGALARLRPNDRALLRSRGGSDAAPRSRLGERPGALAPLRARERVALDDERVPDRLRSGRAVRAGRRGPRRAGRQRAPRAEEHGRSLSGARGRARDQVEGRRAGFRARGDPRRGWNRRRRDLLLREAGLLRVPSAPDSIRGGRLDRLFFREAAARRAVGARLRRRECGGSPDHESGHGLGPDQPEPVPGGPGQRRSRGRRHLPRRRHGARRRHARPDHGARGRDEQGPRDHLGPRDGGPRPPVCDVQLRPEGDPGALVPPGSQAGAERPRGRGLRLGPRAEAPPAELRPHGDTRGEQLVRGGRALAGRQDPRRREGLRRARALGRPVGRAPRRRRAQRRALGGSSVHRLGARRQDLRRRNQERSRRAVRAPRQGARGGTRGGRRPDEPRLRDAAHGRQVRRARGGAREDRRRGALARGLPGPARVRARRPRRGSVGDQARRRLEPAHARLVPTPTS